MTEHALLTTAQLARGFGCSHNTVSNRLAEAGVKRADKRGRSDLYRLADVAPLLAQYCVSATAVDAESLPPLAQKVLWQARNERLKHDRTVGLLVEASDVEAQFAELVKLVAQFFDTLPDVLERDCGLTGDQVERVQESCDRVRQQMYEKVSETP